MAYLFEEYFPRPTCRLPTLKPRLLHTNGFARMEPFQRTTCNCDRMVVMGNTSFYGVRGAL